MTLPDFTTNLQDFCVQAVRDLLAHTPAFQAAVGTTDPDQALARVVEYGGRGQTGDNSPEKLPEYPYAMVTVPGTGDVQLTDTGDGFGIADDWTCSVKVLLRDALNPSAPFGDEKKRFVSLNNTCLLGLRNTYKGLDTEDVEPRDFRLVGMTLDGMWEPNPNEADDANWIALWTVQLKGTLP